VRAQPAAADAEYGTQLRSLAEDLSEEADVGPLLDRMLAEATRRLDGTGGSISLVEEGAGYYRKAADLHVACRSGQVFPLDEGITGQVVARRGPVVFDSYGAVPGRPPVTRRPARQRWRGRRPDVVAGRDRRRPRRVRGQQEPLHHR
jgi:hypothetical protein